MRAVSKRIAQSGDALQGTLLATNPRSTGPTQAGPAIHNQFHSFPINSTMNQDVDNAAASKNHHRQRCAEI